MITILQLIGKANVIMPYAPSTQHLALKKKKEKKKEKNRASSSWSFFYTSKRPQVSHEVVAVAQWPKYSPFT
jgi:hypothetical protein